MTPAVTSAASSRAHARPKAHVFVIDDDEFERVVLPARARGSRFDVEFTFVATGAEIGAALPATRPCLVLCDNRLPPHDDFREIVPMIRSAGYDGAIVVASASTDDPCFEQCAAFGVAEVVDKMRFGSADLDRILETHGGLGRPRRPV